MATISNLYNYLIDKAGVSIQRHQTNLLEFTVNHEQGLSRKNLINELYGYDGFKIKSEGSNNKIKTYTIYK